ncbi:MAG: exodeoxyribonuclease VII small subunit [Clostridia bacterium]|nr:exodeoxyribonuclease VII small subunit [Clostridia bacterium]
MEQNKELAFEEALARLEEIVRALDGGAAPLDESLALFEEGVKLVKLCSGKLDAAEQKVKILVRGEDGNIEERDFAPMQEEKV